MLCKLTNQDMTTHNGTKWEIGAWKETDGSGDMCGAGWLHCYDDPLLAVLHNPIHADIDNPRLWEIEAEGKRKSDGLKSAYTRMRLVKEIPIPEISTTRKIVYAILCVKETGPDVAWNAWADNWLSGKDRSCAAARAAAAAARAADAAWMAAMPMASETTTPWKPISLRKRSVRILEDRVAGYSLSKAGKMVWAAGVAARVAVWAADAGKKINFLALAKKAMEYKE